MASQRQMDKRLAWVKAQEKARKAEARKLRPAKPAHRETYEDRLDDTGESHD